MHIHPNCRTSSPIVYTLPNISIFSHLLRLGCHPAAIYISSPACSFEHMCSVCTSLDVRSAYGSGCGLRKHAMASEDMFLFVQQIIEAHDREDELCKCFTIENILSGTKRKIMSKNNKLNRCKYV